MSKRGEASGPESAGPDPVHRQPGESEVLSGRRALTMPMARTLQEHLGISVDVLRAADDTRVQPLAELD